MNFEKRVSENCIIFFADKEDITRNNFNISSYIKSDKNLKRKVIYIDKHEIYNFILSFSIGKIIISNKDSNVSENDKYVVEIMPKTYITNTLFAKHIYFDNVLKSIINDFCTEEDTRFDIINNKDLMKKGLYASDVIYLTNWKFKKNIN